MFWFLNKPKHEDYKQVAEFEINKFKYFTELITLKKQTVNICFEALRRFGTLLLLSSCKLCYLNVTKYLFKMFHVFSRGSKLVFYHYL